MSIYGEIMDTTKICCNFPPDPIQEIHRDYYLDTIDNLLSRFPIVIVEGPDGIGKTTLLAQYAKRYSDSSISIFITPATRSSYDIETITVDLLSQVWWILFQKELEVSDIENLEIHSQWGLKRIILQKKAKSTRKTFYFVIDGIGDIPDSNLSFIEQIFDLFPIGFTNEFKFLISGNSEKIPPQIINHIPTKDFQLSGFSIDEAYKNLSDLGFSKDEIFDIHKVFKYPGQLASIRRSIQSGQSKSEFLDNLPRELTKLLELEWNKIDLKDNIASEILSLISYTPFELSIDEIGEIVDKENEMVENVLKEIPFISINECQKVNFVSEEQLKHSQKKLLEHKEEIENKLIEFLKKSRDPIASVYLPSVFEKSNKINELLVYLTPEVFLSNLKVNQSLIPLRETALLGVNAAKLSDKNDYLVGLGLQSSIIEELFTSDIWESEINALISLNEIPSALALIERAATKEDRLFLLSVLADAKDKNDFDIQGLDERIENAYKQINHNKLGDKAISIAANLLNILPELAFDLVEKNANIQDEENSLDWAFTRLSIKALNENNGSDKTIDVVEKLNNRIKDPKAQRFLKNRSNLFKNYSSSRIISEVKKFDRVSEQLFFLRSWITKNRETEDIAEIVEFGLRIIISTTEYSPSARDFRELSTPLLYIKDLEKRKELINIIDGQKSTIERLGPIEDYVRILLLLGAAEKDINSEKYSLRLAQTYDYIKLLEDESTKCSCLARFLSMLIELEPEKQLDMTDNLYSIARKDFEETVNDLLNKTAEQYIGTKSIIRALAKNLKEDALEIANKLNGEDRRDRANYDLAIANLDVPDEKLDLHFIKKCLVNIKTKTLMDDLLLQILSRIILSTDLNKLDRQIILSYLDYINNVLDLTDKCNSLCIGILILEKFESSDFTNYRKKLKETLISSWKNIDVGWVKVDIGFKIVEALSEDRDFAHNFFLNVEKYRDSLFLDSQATSFAYLACSKLVIRAFSGLLTKNIDNEFDLKQILTIIGNVPSISERIGLYTDLAMKLRIGKRNDQFSEIVRDYIKPNLVKISDQDNFAFQNALLVSAPALYLFHPISALELIKKLDFINLRDEAYSSICTYIFTKQFRDPIYDPLSKNMEKLAYEEILDICTILIEIENDAEIFHFISKISDSIFEHRNDFSKNQKAEIARKLKEIIEGKFPNEKYIKHHGYKLVSLASIYKFYDAKSSEWNELIEQTKQINISDQVLILCQIAECLPNKQRELRIKLLEEAELKLQEIPSIFDQINRYEILTQSVISDRQLSQKFLKAGMEIILKHDELDLINAQRRYIDIAYKIDPDFAASLASMADDDPARARTRLNLQKRVAQIKLKNQMADNETRNNPPEILNQRDYSYAAWMLLGSLNAKRIAPSRFESIKEYAIIGATQALSESYPIFSWLIQNTVNKYQDTPQANVFLRPLFDATLTGCNLIIAIAEKSTAQLKNAKSSTKDQTNSSVLVIDKGTEEAKEILIEWIKNNLEDEFFIADPYFGIKELWILQIIKGIRSDCKITILTSKEHNRHLVNPEIDYQDYWRLNVSDQEPPWTEIVIADMGLTGQSPIHDRWWISGNNGLRLGTSINGYGGRRISDISALNLEEVEERSEIIKRFAVTKDRYYKNEKIKYSSFTL